MQESHSSGGSSDTTSSLSTLSSRVEAATTSTSFTKIRNIYAELENRCYRGEAIPDDELDLYRRKLNQIDCDSLLNISRRKPVVTELPQEDCVGGGDRKFDETILQLLEQNYCCFPDEHICAYEVMYKKRKLTRKQRHFLLTNYQVLYFADVFTFKGRVLLDELTSVYEKSANELHMIRGDTHTRDYHLESAEVPVTRWARELRHRYDEAVLRRHTMQTVLYPIDEGPWDSVCECVVFIGGAENLPPLTQSRPNNPFVCVGLGIPELMEGFDYPERRQSTARKNTTSPVFNESLQFRVCPYSSMIMDVRVYSHQGSRTPYCYGTIRVPLASVLTHPDGCTAAWYHLDVAPTHQTPTVSPRSQPKLYLRVSIVKSKSDTTTPQHTSSILNDFLVVPSLPISTVSEFILWSGSPLVCAVDGRAVGRWFHSQEGIWLIDVSQSLPVLRLHRGAIYYRNTSSCIGLCKEHGTRNRQFRLLTLLGEVLFRAPLTSGGDIWILNVTKQRCARLLVEQKNEGKDGKRAVLTVFDTNFDVSLLLVCCYFALTELSQTFTLL